MIIKVIKTSSLSFWYARCIGELFEVKPRPEKTEGSLGNVYRVTNTTHRGMGIYACDAIVVGGLETEKIPKPNSKKVDNEATDELKQWCLKQLETNENKDI